jgi:hypothetical protein
VPGQQPAGKHPTGQQPTIPRQAGARATGPQATGSGPAPTGPGSTGQGTPGAPGPTGTGPRAEPPPPNRARNWVLAAALLVVLLVAGAVYLLTSRSSGDEDGSASVAANVDIGDPVELRNAYGDRLTITVRSAESKPSCGSAARPPETGRYLVADVTIEVSSGTASVKATDFDFAPAAGGWPHRDIGPDFTGCGGTGLGAMDNAPAGTKHQGRLVFDVTGAGHIVYHVTSGTSPFGAQWKVDAS